MIVPANPFPSFAFAKSSHGASWLSGGLTYFALGRQALLHALIRLGLVPGDEIVVPAYYCDSALMPLRRYGFRFVFVDVNDNLEISSAALQSALSGARVRVALFPHYFGIVATARSEIISQCRNADIGIIEDYSHSFLSFRRMDTIGREADAYIFSMRKTLPVADGGALCCNTNDGIPASRPFWFDLPYLAKRILEQALIKLGWTNIYGSRIGRLRVAISRSGTDIEEREDLRPSFCLAGYLRNARYLQCVAERRVANYRKLVLAVAPHGVKIISPDIPDDLVPQVLAIRDTNGILADHLRERGIGAYRWPGEEMPAEVRTSPHFYPNAMRLNESIVCLPVHQDINDKHISFMSGVIAEWATTASRMSV